MRDLRDAVGILGPKQVVDHNDMGNQYREKGASMTGLSRSSTRPSGSLRTSRTYTRTGGTPMREEVIMTGAIADYDEAIRLKPEVAAYYSNRGSGEA